jgi:outer membrane protein assembly factor BamB
MNEKQLTWVLVGLLASIAAAIVLLAFRLPAPVAVEKRVADLASERRAGTLPRSAGPANTNVVSQTIGASEKVNINGDFSRGEGQPGPASSAWPHFRGVNFNNIAADSGVLFEKWEAAGPKQLWIVPLSEGHSGPAVWNGSVYIMDYDDAKEADVLRRLSLADGKEIWRRWYKVATKRNHGVSRSVPAVTEKFTVTMGPRCHVMCADTETGDFKWGLDLVADYGSEVPLWYTGQNPWIDDGVAVLAPAGKALLMGVECATGKILWQAPNPNGWKMSHSSVMPMTLLGKRTYVYCSLGGIVGVSAETADRGTALWKSAAWTHSVLAPSPVQIDDHRIFLTSGYGGGSMMLGLTNANGAIAVGPIFELQKTVFACEQHTPIFWHDRLFGILPKDAGGLRGEFVCLNTDGEMVWESGKSQRFGLGPFLFADNKVLILNDTGELTLIRASTSGYEQLARARVLPGRDAWAPMALVDGKLLLRDSEHLVCLEVGRAELKVTANGK